MKPMARKIISVVGLVLGCTAVAFAILGLILHRIASSGFIGGGGASFIAIGLAVPGLICSIIGAVKKNVLGLAGMIVSIGTISFAIYFLISIY